MTDYDPDDNDVRDASITDTTRRGALAALGLGSLAALGSGHATADLAGGPESDAMSEHRVPLYRVPEPDLDSPGVVGRRVEITAGGSSYAAGDQLVDTGSSWERISAGVESLNTEKLVNVYDYIIDPSDDDVATVLNNLSKGESVWLGIGEHTTTGTYSDGPVIDITANDVTVAGATGSLIKHDGSSTDSGEGSKIIEVESNDVTFHGFTIDGDYQNSGTIDNNTDGHNLAVFGDGFVMRGVRSQFSTGDGYEPFGNDHTVTNCVFIENWEQNIHYNGCQNVTVSNCLLKREINNGMVITYAGSGQTTKNCSLEGCLLIGGSSNGIRITTGVGSVEGFAVSDTRIINPTGDAIQVVEDSNADSPPTDITISDVTIKGPSRDGLRLNARTEIKDITVDNLKIFDCDNAAVTFIKNNDGDYTDVEIKEPKIINPRLSSTGEAINMAVDGGTMTRVELIGGKVVSRAAGSDVDKMILNQEGTGTHTDCTIRDIDLYGFTDKGVNKNPTGIDMRGNGGDYVGHNSGQAVFSGDGSTTTFSISHGMSNQIATDARIPYNVQIESADARAAAPISTDLGFDTLDVTFSTAPTSGTDNVALNWRAGYE